MGVILVNKQLSLIGCEPHYATPVLRPFSWDMLLSKRAQLIPLREIFPTNIVH